MFFFIGADENILQFSFNSVKQIGVNNFPQWQDMWVQEGGISNGGLVQAPNQVEAKLSVSEY